MRVGLVAPPFICVPPKKYGGTELFVAHLAEGIERAGHEAVVYTVGDSTVNAERRWLYEHCEWPLKSDQAVQFKDLVHHAWAVRDAARDCDVVHVQSAPALSFSGFVQVPLVYTVHHVHEGPLSNYYANFPDVQFVAISDFQKQGESMARIETIHHGVDTSLYRLTEQKQDYLVFLGRFAPIKGAHLAIEAAKLSGIPLKMAGEIQPIYQDYFDSMIKPHIDGKFIEYVGEADLAMKNDLLGGARALLFPIQWDEPFGLVMIESMACGTPVLALSGGSVAEVVKNGVSGQICSGVEHMAKQAVDINLAPLLVRGYCEQFFSVYEMTKKYLNLYRRTINRFAAEKADEEEMNVVSAITTVDLSEEAAA